MKFIKTGFIKSITCFPKSVWQDDCDFRKAKWGMSKEEVRASEDLRATDEDNDSIHYKTNLLNYDVNFSYRFENGKLESTNYEFWKTDRDSPSRYISAYADFKAMLKNQYGPPEIDDNLESRTSSSSIYSSWKTDRSRIFLECDYDSGGEPVLVLIIYLRKLTSQESHEYMKQLTAKDRDLEKPLEVPNRHTNQKIRI